MNLRLVIRNPNKEDASKYAGLLGKLGFQVTRVADTGIDFSSETRELVEKVFDVNIEDGLKPHEIRLKLPDQLKHNVRGVYIPSEIEFHQE